MPAEARTERNPRSVIDSTDTESTYEWQPHRGCRHLIYKLTCDEFDQLRERAQNRCEICGEGPKPTQRGMLFIDHDEMKGKWAVRGLLCVTCNSSLGLPHFARTEPAQAYLANPFRTEEPVRPPRGRPMLRTLRIPPHVLRATGSLATEDRDELYRLSRRHNRAELATEACRQDLRAKVIEVAARGGMIADLVRATGLNRESVRLWLIEHRRASASQPEDNARRIAESA